MQKQIEAIYENGVLKPLSSLDLKEHEKVEIIVKEKISAAKMTQGIIKGLDSKSNEITAISTNDSDFERIDFITVYKPSV